MGVREALWRCVQGWGKMQSIEMGMREANGAPSNERQLVQGREKPTHYTYMAPGHDLS